MPNTSKTNNPDLLARSGSVSHQRTVGSETGTEHRRGNVRVQLLWDREDPSLVRPDVAGITTLGNHTAVLLGPLTSIRVDHDVRAVSLVLVLALLALAAGEGLRAHADALPFFDQRHLGSHADGRPQDLMADSEREMLRSPPTYSRTA